MACCSPSPSTSSPSQLQPAKVATHPASDAYLTAVYSVLGLTAAAGLGYAGYRYYTDVYASRSKAAAVRGIVEKRAAYPVKEVADERRLDQAINEAQSNLAPVSPPLPPPSTSLFAILRLSSPLTCGCCVEWCY